MIDLSGKTALITGGSRGVGEAAALLLAQAGANVALTFRERAQAAADVVSRVSHEATERRPGVAAIAIQADVSARDDCERAVQETVSQFGRLDIFVANAGVWPSEDVSVANMRDDRWQNTLAVNLHSVFFGCRAALNAMSASRTGKPADPPTDGRIVVVSSTAGQRGEAYHADYAATKGAIIAFVKSLAVEAAPEITVNAVAPGWIDTEMSRGPYQRDDGRGRLEIERAIPLHRVASARDVAGPILFLCSDLARHVTGETLNVNGGAVLCG